MKDSSSNWWLFYLLLLLLAVMSRRLLRIERAIEKQKSSIEVRTYDERLDNQK